MKSIRESHKVRPDSLTRAFFTRQPANILSISATGHSQVQLPEIYQISKRSLDICGALIGLFVLALILPIIAFCIYKEDRGPIFYKQVRIGQYGQLFTIYKLRSMVQDADSMLEQQARLRSAWQQCGKLRNDPRVTEVGKFLRRSSLDELPQMLNVLRGEMSLVGPRAIQCSELTIFEEIHQFRQLVKPGITGLWQISGRSRIDYAQRRLLDCLYVLGCSLNVDISILIRTIPTILCGMDAY